MLTQDLSMATRVHNSRVHSTARHPAVEPICPLDLMVRSREKRNYYQRRSSAREAYLEAQRAEARIQARTDKLLASLQPATGSDGRVLRGVWWRKRTREED